MADLRQEVGLGLQLGGADSRSGVLAAAVRLPLPLSFEQGEAEQQPRQRRKTEEPAGEPARIELIEAQQHWHEEHHPEREQRRPGHHQTGRFVALPPVITRHGQHAARRRQHQRVDQPAVPGPLNKQDAGGQRQHQVEFDAQQPGDPGAPALIEEAQRVAEQSAARGQGREIGDQRLAVGQPRQPYGQHAEVGRGAAQQRTVQQAEPDMGVAEGVGEAQQVVERQQRERAEQRTEQIGRLVLVHQSRFVDGLEPGHQWVTGLQADVGLTWLAIVGQAEQVGTAGQRTLADRAHVAGRCVALQSAVAQQIEVQILRAWCEHPEPLGFGQWRQADLQPDRPIAGRCAVGKFVQALEQRALGNHFIQREAAGLVDQQAPVLWYGISGKRGGGRRRGNGSLGRQRDQVDQQQAEDDSYGNPEPTH